MLNSRDISLLRPDVAVNCRLLLGRCEAAGLQVTVTNTVRDAAYQAHLYAQGRTRPGNIVRGGFCVQRKTPAGWRGRGIGRIICCCK